MNNRKDFLKKITLGTIGLGLGRSGIQKVKFTDHAKIGLITNTIRNEIQEDYKSALQMAADIGYKYIEGDVPENVGSVDEYQDFLKQIGLQSIATGSSMANLQENLGQTFEVAKALGSKFIVCYWPWLSSAENLNQREVMETADRINEIGKKVKEAGFRFAWHNHDKEFVNINGELAFDMLMQHTDPDYSTVQLDWYWVSKGGQDPVEYFKKYPGRFELAHVKDMNNNRDQGITCVGNGILDFKHIFNHVDTGGVEYFIVENERAVKGFQCARQSFTHIKEILT